MKKIALVTGANKGIGLETARQLASMGITVLLGARNIESGKKAASEICASGGDAHFIELDITNPEHQQNAYDFIKERYGRLDILVNNAAIALETHLPPVSTVSPEILRATFETNFFAAVAITQKLLPLLHKSTAGRIVNVSSRLGSVSLNANPPSAAWYDELGYGASKASLNMFTILLARELANTNIKVNSAHPGAVKTSMGVASATLEVAEGAYTSVWLATLPEDGPTGEFFHKQERLPW